MSVVAGCGSSATDNDEPDNIPGARRACIELGAAGEVGRVDVQRGASRGKALSVIWDDIELYIDRADAV